MSLPFVEVLTEGEGNPIYHAIFALKHHAQAMIEQLHPAPQSALLMGILLGNDNGLPKDLAEDFRTTGMTHIIAISGKIATTLLAQIKTGLHRNPITIKYSDNNFGL